ncbi:cyclic beta 1-2 glucan synthetase [Luteimonas sp. BDR2-5]|uniref:glycoside hydrolase family 94 protein n=1 Tax=Proluteimonas luteida TaxID=2878685 RepID=UPI001E5B60B4|nr:glycoside hydrolase family 94 protein [Luteimonas sp. BDR2-5]MCD9029379.1 cyclic beta 1-2 glucan synthetase [Luteimonas sp. BDR2-5]
MSRRWPRLRGLFARSQRPADPATLDVEAPLRAQLFSAEQMALHGKALALTHRVHPGRVPDRLLARLGDNAALLDDARTFLAAMVRDDVRIAPAGEWLLDNFHLVEEQVRLARRHLPKGYSRELPALSQGPSAGLPRVYDLAMEAVAHGDGQVDATTLRRFVAAYQSVTPLTLGELWAIPIMLRLAVIENLRRMAVRVMRDGRDHRLARRWAERLNATAARAPKDVVLVVADMARSKPPATGAFVAELTRGLQGRGALLSMPLTWVEQWLTDNGLRIEALVHVESQQQAANQVSIGNSIGSLRFLATMDWRDYVESMSHVDAILRQDPGATYRSMDFSTRDHYRHAVERIARRAGASETDVARATVQLAQAHPADTIEAHVGYYLVDDGVGQTAQALGAARGRRPIRVAPRTVPLPLYLALIAVIVALATSGMLGHEGVGDVAWAPAWLLAALGVLVFSELGIALVNWLATVVVPPRPLPRLDFSHGIPVGARTLVVVPCMFGDPAEVDALVEGLEVRFLANRDPHLHFALLSDHPDADQSQLPDDAATLAHAVARISALNQRYPTESPTLDGDRFFLFHRPRTWNAGEGRWIGHERKRGKLAALNRVLRGGDAGAFQQIVGDTAVLAGVRYVITLDSDTRLPRDAAREFVGTLAHPLNRARFDPQRGRVSRGYGILQPSIGSSFGGRRITRYARMFGSEPGIDPYTRAVSDVYQDLFGEGSFVGKGIYDVDAFEQALQGRFPDNRILSHDLLEGCHARAGLVSDVRLYEDHPSRYAADVKRRHRWIRGDWQLLPWLLPWVPTASGARVRNPLSWLSRGKLVDNLRRSLVPASLLALLLLGWLTLASPWAWTFWLMTVFFAPVLVPALRDLLSKPPDMRLDTHLLQVGDAVGRGLLRAVVNFACLPYEAMFSLSAIVTTLWRTLVTRRHLLQWNPSSEVERALGSGVAAELRTMWIAPLLSLAVAAALWRVNPQVLWVAGPVLALWAASPPLMAWLGRAPPQRSAQLSPPQRAFLGRLARRTWAFFEVNIREQDHWLPPDNIQEHPALVVARRTSPTNIGLSLLANLAAWDFGYLQADALADRTRRVFATLDLLPRHRGHFYNWYDTETLAPLPPHYVSTVDSGNLAGHLLTLRQGLLTMIDAPVLAPRTFAGLADTLGVLVQAADAQEQADAAWGEAWDAAIAAFAARLEIAIVSPPTTLHAARDTFDALLALADPLLGMAPPSSGADMCGDDPAYWCGRLHAGCHDARDLLLALLPSPDAQPGAADDPSAASLPSLRELCAPTRDRAVRELARARVRELERLAHVAGQFSLMEYGFLYDPARHLLAIGYDVDNRRLDQGHYDLLASEARLCSFVAIAQGQLPQDTWFALGRLLTEVDGDATLLSWSGSMFEYLMPQLVMPSYPDTLLDQTSRHAVRAQIAYGRQHDVPWGISESGYNAVDARMNYQYRAFGVPRLGLKRGLGEDLVIAPYATMMALMVEPEAATQNLQRLDAMGFSGRFGLFEAIDFTANRLPVGQTHAVVRSFMAHHQGMGLLALDHLLCGQPMQRRFVADAEFQATLLLLQERVPRTGVFRPHEAVSVGVRTASAVNETRLRVFRTADTARPAVQMLSNGRFHALLTSAGGSYLRLRDMAVTRWREDGTRDHWGSFCYLRDVDSDLFWSAAYQPTCVPVEHYEAIFSDAKAEFRGRKSGLETHLEIAISAEDDIELRRLRLSNRSRRPRTVEITTYAEVVLAPAIADELHPAFSNLFVQTEIVRDKQALLCTRRPRAQDELPPWMLHLVAAHGADITTISYETDRARFLGRGNTPRAPQAMAASGPLSDTAGSVLDPIVAIRIRVTLAPEQTAILDLVTGVGDDREACAALIDKYRDRRLADRVFDLAWTHSQVVRRQINASQADAQLYERIAGLMVFAHPFLRADSAVLLQNRRGQSGLWGHSISGDLPIVLVQIADADNIELVRQMVQAHAYWRLKGLHVDLVIWNEDQAGYRQQLQEQILGLVSAGPEGNVLDRPGGIFVRPAQQISQEDRILIQSVARVIVGDQHGTLAAQVGRHVVPERNVPLLLTQLADPVPAAGRDAGGLHGSGGLDDLPPGPADAADASWPFGTVADDLLFDNGTGAFAADGREYVIVLEDDASTPAPWSNVMANPALGTVVSESAPGYTWFENAHEFRLTPWHNDPVSDTGGEAFYLRDEDSGHVWSPMPLPRRGHGAYRTRHGFGYSVYAHVEDGIASELWVYVALRDAVKFSVLKLRNLSGRARRLSATGYVEWILGDIRVKSQMHVVSEQDPASGVLTARNPYNTEFAGRVAFFDVDGDRRSFTADRTEFLGRNGSLRDPDAMRRERLSGRLGAGLDPCTAIQVQVDLAPAQATETVFRLGIGDDMHAALQLAQRLRGSMPARGALEAVRLHWQHALGTLRVETPEPATDLLVNGWLLYQTLACRYVARSGYYQSGGAFGFRDQLQDTMATVHALPALTRAHLLLSAAHQFPQGDVLHWWHPPADRGVRTRCSDDYLWLPLAACRYLDVTGDDSVLDARVGFIEGRLVNPDEESYYDLPMPSGRVQSFYDHCVIALQRGMSLLGARGLPLIGTGDWNDGMNRVGEGGRGESVWLGFFLFDVLQRFAPVAEARGDTGFAATCREAAAQLQANLEAHAWDGDWYRRAWFDDGTPIGSHASDECRIDSISQSWAVLSGAADPARARRAMAALDAHLVKRDAGLIQLLEPPFDRTTHDPGYIRGYVPGVRENGGQYTHAAVWSAMAFAALGDRERAWELARMINPVHHAADATGAAVYKVEPYVLAADVYGVAPHVGRGGWTWYTGSAGWMYRLLTESLLGLQRSGDTLRIVPCMPAAWPGYRMQLRHGAALYRIEVVHVDAGPAALWLDGARQDGLAIALQSTDAVHEVVLQWPRDGDGGDP